MQVAPTKDVRHKVELQKNLSDIDKTCLEKTLFALLGPAARMLDNDGKLILGAKTPNPKSNTAQLNINSEPVGHIEATASDEQLQAAGFLVQKWLQNAAGVVPDSISPDESPSTNYLKLAKKYAVLQESERHYRELTNTLEQRIAEQEQAIESIQLRLEQAQETASLKQLSADLVEIIEDRIDHLDDHLNLAHSYTENLAPFATLVQASDEDETLVLAWQEGNLNSIIDDLTGILNEITLEVANLASLVHELR